MKNEEIQQYIGHSENHELLIDLPYHKQLHVYVDDLLAQGVTHIAVLSLGLDAFRDINDGLGHAVGHQVLQAVAKKIEMQLLAGQRLEHSNGDVFTIVAPDCDVDVALQLVQQMQRVIKQPFTVHGYRLHISACIGIALNTESDCSPDILLEGAQIAMHTARIRGYGSYCFFGPEMRRQAYDCLILKLALQRALAENELQLHYQPQVCLNNGRLHGVEALARWHDPELGIVSPELFIGLLEEIGEIENFGRWVLRTACAQMASWHADGLDVPAISVNLCALSFRDPELPAYITQLLHTFSLSGNFLTIEITESKAVVITPTMLQTMNNIRALGVGLSVDDFGTGFSSLSNLLSLPITELKIDRGFVGNCVQNDRYRLLVLALIDLGRKLHLNVVAEGVENDEQCNLLLQQGCPVVQGYFFSPPRGPQAMAQWLERAY